MKTHQTPIGKNDEWLTPPEILQALGKFDLDPAAPAERPWPTAKDHYSLPADGLSAEWNGRVWLNPPFDRRQRPDWMRKMADHGNGIMLIPAATETRAFDDYVWKRANALCFMRGRPHFHFVDGKRASFNCGTAIVLVAFGAKNVMCLHESGLGHTITLSVDLSARAEANSPNGRRAKSR